MGSKKRSAWAKETAAFKAQLDGAGFDDLFAREDKRRKQLAAEHDAALRYKACERKNRYASRSEAEATAAACAEHGARNLHVYKCPHCNGWHLTSKGQAN